METTSGTVTIWQSGRLAQHRAARAPAWRREQGQLAGLLVLSAVVLTMYVVVLERDVDGVELQHAAQHSRAVARAQCEADQPAALRRRCIGMLDGDVAALDGPAPAIPAPTAVEAAYAQENAARATTLSLLAAR